MRRRRGLFVVTSVALAATVIPGGSVGAAPGAVPSFQIEVVSSPAEYVSGDDARLLVHLPPGLDGQGVDRGQRSRPDPELLSTGQDDPGRCR